MESVSLEGWRCRSNLPDGSRVRLPTIFLGGTTTGPLSIARLDVPTGMIEVLKQEFEVNLSMDDLSPPQAISFPTTDAKEAHAFYYAPRNNEHEAPQGTHPPLLVISHGGPTGTTFPYLNFDIQYWTSRGFAVVDVNYGGSSGFGREYRQRLKGSWGIVDVDDCCNGEFSS